MDKTIIKLKNRTVIVHWRNRCPDVSEYVKEWNELNSRRNFLTREEIGRLHDLSYKEFECYYSPIMIEIVETEPTNGRIKISFLDWCELDNHIVKNMKQLKIQGRELYRLYLEDHSS